MADAEKTEEPTAKRRQDAREKGDVPKSQDVVTLVLLTVALLALWSPVGAELGRELLTSIRALLAGEIVRPASLGDYQAVLVHHGILAGLALMPFVLILGLAGTLGHVGQTGWLVSGYPLQPRLEKLSPSKGIKRLFNLDKLMELAKASVKLAVIIVLLWVVIAPRMPELMSLVDAAPVMQVKVAGELARDLVILILLSFAVFAVIDLVWTRYRYHEKLKMTKQEVRDERRQREGDPLVRGQMRRRAMTLSRQRIIAAIPEADVVVTNPTHYAVALRYRPLEDAAPVVLAKGRNHLALRIREEAGRHGIPIVENPPVAQLLYRQGRVGQAIPEALYKAVAEVLAYLHRLDPSRSRVWKAAS